jgi:hypothetical protein
VIQSWCPAQAIKREDRALFVLPCNTKYKEGNATTKCTGSFVVGARPPTTLVNSPYVGGWYLYNMGEKVDKKMDKDLDENMDEDTG